MANGNRHPFDLPVAGVDERYWSMKDLMACASACIEKRQWKTAQNILEEAVQANHLPAKLELARLLARTPELGIPGKQRYDRAERLYREVLSVLDLPDSTVAAAAMGLSGLYGDCMGRPVGCLAMLLMAKRHGAKVSDREVELASKRIARMDVNSFGSNRRDAYELGLELAATGKSVRSAELFLREAAMAEARDMAGGAYLALVELYQRDMDKYPEHRKEAARCLAAAAERGNPEYMSQEIWTKGRRKQDAPSARGWSMVS